MHTQTKDTQVLITPDQALSMLEEGNKRFVNGRQSERNLMSQVKETSNGQFPFAVVLSCIDSRIPAEMVFDQGIGDIFSIRIAGNFVNSDILGSMEFACKVAGAKLVVVLGHSSCGAVKGACDHVVLGNLTGMLENINPAVLAIDEKVDRSSGNKDFVQKVADKNVELSLEAIIDHSQVLREMRDNGDIKLVGGMYSVETGEVKFY